MNNIHAPLPPLSSFERSNTGRDSNSVLDFNSLSAEEALLLEARLVGFRELPPTIDEFIEDDYFIGQSTNNGRSIYPKWRQFLRELYPDPIHTTNNVVALGGAIGIGKSRISRIIMAYDYCKLTYLDDLSYSSLDNHLSGKSIDLLFEHRTKDKAWEELVDPFHVMVDKSPYLSKGLLNDYGTRFLVDGETTNEGIGKDLLSFVCTECNFQNKAKMIAKVDELTSRLTSRFQKMLNYLPHIILDSSANDEGNFMDEHLATTTWTVKHATFSQWEMKDFMNMFFLKGEFFVYAGDSVHEPFIIEDGMELKDTMNPDKVIRCPKELEDEARADVRRFLKEKCGITTTTTGVFIVDRVKLKEQFVIQQPVVEVVTDFFDEQDTIWNKVGDFLLPNIPEERKVFIGVDLGLVNDRTGLAVAYFDGYSQFSSGILEPIIKVPLGLSVTRIPGQETAIYKIKEFIVELNKHREVALVLTDQYQSSQLRQDLELVNIKAKLSSVDRTTEPYNYLKSGIYKGLIQLPTSDLLFHELSNLIDTGKKIDHINDGSHWKDISDAVTNAVYNVFLNLTIAAQPSIKIALKDDPFKLFSEVFQAGTEYAADGNYDRTEEGKEAVLKDILGRINW